MQPEESNILRAVVPDRAWFAGLAVGSEPPSRALNAARRSGMLAPFPELLAMVGVRQDPEWHPEGDVWTHTLMVVDEAWELAKKHGLSPDRTFVLVLGGLLHDIGKPATTKEVDGRIRAINHEQEGIGPARVFLSKLGASDREAEIVEAIVANHMTPQQLYHAREIKHELSDEGYERAVHRLMRKVPQEGWDLFLLACEADHRGRGTGDAKATKFGWQSAISAVPPLSEDHLPARPPRPLVTGDDLTGIGFPRGPEIGVMLRRLADAGRETPESLAQLSAAVEARRAACGSSFYAPPRPLRVENDDHGAPHPHATTRYKPLADVDCFNALQNLLACRERGYRTLNIHLPHEIQFDRFRNVERGEQFMWFVERAGAVLGVGVVWENAPLLDEADWSLRENTTLIPEGHPLCLDIGHLMLGSASRAEALGRIDTFMERHGANVRHLHLHVNDFRRDLHRCERDLVIEFLGAERFERLTRGRTYIFERGDWATAASSAAS